MKVAQNIILAMVSLTVLFLGFTYFVPYFLPYRIIYSGGLIGFVALAAWRPVWGLMIFSFFLPILNTAYISRHIGFFPPMMVLSSGLAAGVMIRSWPARRELPSLAPPLLDRLILANILLIVLSGCITILRYVNFYPLSGGSYRMLAINVYEETSTQAALCALYITLILAQGFAFFFTARKLILGLGDLRRLIIALALGLCFTILCGAFQSMGHVNWGNPEHFAVRNRINATFSDPNALGGFMVLAIPALIGAIIATKHWLGRTGLGLVLGGCLFLLGRSGSRTGLLGVCLAVLFAFSFYLYYVQKYSLRKLSVIVIGIAATMIGLVALILLTCDPATLPESLRRINDALLSLKQNGLKEVIYSERLRAWLEGWRVIRQQPFTGLGLGAYWHDIPNILRLDLHPGFRDNPNNQYLLSWAELGLVGMLLYLAIAMQVMRVMHRVLLRSVRQPASQYILLLLISGSIVSLFIMFLTGPHDRNAEVQLLLGLFVGCLSSMHYQLYPPVTATRKAQVLQIVVGIAMIATLGAQLHHALQRTRQPAAAGHYRYNDYEGFYQPYEIEPGVRARWIMPDSLIKIPPGIAEVSMRLKVAHSDAATHPVVVRFFIDDREIGQETFTQTHEVRNFSFSLSYVDRYQELRMVTSRPHIPERDNRFLSDRRTLGVLIIGMQYTSFFKDEAGVPYVVKL